VTPDSRAPHSLRSVDGVYGVVVVGDIAPEEAKGTAEIWASLAFPASVKRYRWRRLLGLAGRV